VNLFVQMEQVRDPRSGDERGLSLVQPVEFAHTLQPMAFLAETDSMRKLLIVLNSTLKSTHSSLELKTITNAQRTRAICKRDRPRNEQGFGMPDSSRRS
jgi:hypothetical protein